MTTADNAAGTPPKVTITVASEKGGSGKSATAMLIAGQIAQSYQAAARAGMLDATNRRVRPLRVVN